MRARIVALLLWLLAPTVEAQRVVLDVPARLAARELDLRAGDVLDGVDGPLDGAMLASLEALAAPAGPVPLRRGRARDWLAIELPAGSWELETLPAIDGADLDALIQRRGARDWSGALAALDTWAAAPAAAAHRADALLLRARWLALSGDWKAADATLDDAQALAPARAADFLEYHLRTLERRADRTAGLALADRLVALRAEGPPQRRIAALLMRSRARSLVRDNGGSIADAQAALALAGDTLDAAQAHLLLGFAALRGGDRSGAAREYATARARIEALAPRGLEHGAILAQQATLAGITGEPDVLARFDAALALLRAAGSDHPLLGAAAMNAHLLAMQRRRFDAAESYARESLAVFTRVAPNTLFDQQARTALADVLMRRAQFEESETLFREALAAADAIDPRSYEALSTRLQVGQVLLHQGRFAEALADFDAVAAALAAAPADSAVRATTLDADVLGYRLHALIGVGDFERARAAGEQLMARYVALNRSDTVRAEVLLGIGEADWRAGRLAEARAHYDDALARYLAAGAGAIQLGRTHFLRARVRRDAGDVDGALADYLAAIDALERHRDVVGGDDDIRTRWAAQYQDFYKEPLALLAARGDAAGAAGLEQRYRMQVLRRLFATPEAQRAAWAADGATSPGAALDDDQALVSFVSTGEAVIAFAWRRDRLAPAMVRIALPAHELAARVDRLRLLAARGDPPVATRAAFDAQSLALYRALFDPLLPMIGDAPRWTLVADGPLRRLPWAALATDDATPPTRLVEQRTLAQAASPAVFARGARTAAHDGPVVGFADVDPDHAPARDPRRDPDLATPLPGARREVDALVALHGARAISFTGRAATEATVRGHAPGAAIVHFAVHGVLDPHDPMRSFLALARGSGAADDDGRLSASEIAASLRLTGALVVLSSCESALGGDAGGEGLLGMSRALAAAGARGVVGTLWRVADGPTARLATDFHRHLRDGLPPDAALAVAQREWLARARSPGLAERLRQAFGLDDALPAQADQPFHWAGLTLEHVAGAR